MPVIVEEVSASPNMDEFVNWDNVASPRTAEPVDGQAALLFEDPDADDFSYWALEHFAQSASAEELPLDDSFQPVEIWENNEPCAHCSERGYQCKTISEGNYKGYCTSCVALRRECSFGLASGVPVPTANSFPPNPWPTLGDHPDPILNDIAAAAPPLVDSVGMSQAAPVPQQPKLGARFSRESVRILKNWVSTHSRHPYPTEDEKEALQRLTGLNKTQISNWLANARRRGKIPATRSTSPHVRNTWPGPQAAMDIPQPARRSGTPLPSLDRHLQQIDNLPLQRWANSPPENEPASVTDIARAITSSSSAVSSGLTSPYFTDDGSSRSLFNGSSASSNGTSHSSDALSYGSRGSFVSFVRGRRRRRRRSGAYSGVGGTSSDEWDADRGSRHRGPAAVHAGKRPAASRTATTGPTSLLTPLKTYQCTFCTETFKTKHDWQRHEKSLHLSLERWVCAPQGAVVVHPDTRLPSCVFCGAVHPDEAHTEAHNFSVCQERSPGDRTFYRKDHLRQHLKLVHGVKYAGWAMDAWKVATPEIRSRCGFCGIAMDTWTFRTDHLADHFKTGRTMADWKGDWGFEEPVLKMVENSIPPYLIHDERNSPLPFSASVASPESPRNAYELLRGELAFWLRNQNDAGGDRPEKPADDAFLVEACRVILAAEVRSQHSVGSPSSWLYDLLMGREDCLQAARLSPIRSAADSQLQALCINGKETLFADCPLEKSLQRFVAVQAQFGLRPTSAELQAEASCIMRQIEAELLHEMAARRHHHHDTVLEAQVVAFLMRQVYRSTDWLAAFRARAHLPPADDDRADDPPSIDAAVHNSFGLEADLAVFVRQQLGAGLPLPDDDALQRHARLVLYGREDSWNQTRADDAAWLQSFRRKHMPDALAEPAAPGFLKPSPFFLNDTNCYRRLARELTRYVSAAMSPNNPHCHVPTDEELQHQARWILYDDDDPWNQTAADNAEWLMRFKRDVGILPAGPGLVNILSWNVCQGGTGFAPPYCFPKTPMGPYGATPAKPSPESQGSQGSQGSQEGQDRRVTVVQLQDGDYARETQYGLASATANNFLQTFTTRYAKPATVFCSRELENGLAGFVRTAVAAGAPFPDDAALRVRAREILGTAAGDKTAADDDELLGKFKEMVRAQLAGEAEAEAEAGAAAGMDTALPLTLDHPLDSLNSLNAMDPSLDLSSVTQTDIDNMLQEMHFDFSTEMDFVTGQ